MLVQAGVLINGCNTAEYAWFSLDVTGVKLPAAGRIHRQQSNKFATGMENKASSGSMRSDNPVSVVCFI